MALKDGRDCKVKFLIKVVASVLAAVAVAVKSISWHLMWSNSFSYQADSVALVLGNCFWKMSFKIGFPAFP